MKFKLLVWLVFLVVVSLPVFADSDHDDNEILLQLAPGVSIDTINARYNTTVEDTILGGTVYEVTVADSANLDATVAAMQNDPDILFVEYNYFGQSPEAVRRTIAVIDGDPSPSKYRDQDAFLRVKAAQAQTISTGQGVVVAIIDTGVDYNHPDLSAHILRDQNNAVVGYDFIDHDSDPMDTKNNIDDDQDGLIDEGVGHGTHVAGIVSLIAPNAKIMPLRVLNSDGFGTANFVAKAIDYAVEYSKERDVPVVINLSLNLPTESFAVQDSLQEAYEEGIPVVASAGNGNTSLAQYPAAADSNTTQVISVAATDQNAIKANFSNFGKGWIDLSAPGVGIYSTFPSGQYAWWEGTSMSAPFVSGEAALVLSVLDLHRMNHQTRLSSLLAALTQGTDYIYGVNPAYKKGQQLGSGNMDAYSAVLQTQGSDVLTIKKAVYNSSRASLTISARSSRPGLVQLTVEGYGRMTYNPTSKTYKLKMSTGTAPQSVTITSTGNGVISGYVAVK